MVKRKSTGPKLKDRDVRAYTGALRKTQAEIAKEEGVTQQAISKRVAKATAVLDASFIQAFRDRLAQLSDYAYTGLENHLLEKKPEPRVLMGFLEGMTFLRREIEGNLVLQNLTDAELSDRAKKYLGNAPGK